MAFTYACRRRRRRRTEGTSRRRGLGRALPPPLRSRPASSPFRYSGSRQPPYPDSTRQSSQSKTHIAYIHMNIICLSFEATLGKMELVTLLFSF